jgi:hypothetical protein
MKRLLPPLLLPLLVALLPLPSSASFLDDFAPRTMRVDYFHSGGMGEERIALDRIVSDGPWPGSRTTLVDRLDLGKFRFRVVDVPTGRLVYSRGFATVFGEWETTDAAKKQWGTFHESLRFPWPRRPVDLFLERRDPAAGWKPVWSTRIDPASREVNPADVPPAGKVWSLFENGLPETKVDLLILGDGYRADEMEKFHADARRLVDRLFREEPFKSRRRDFNVRAIDVPSSLSGVNRPHQGAARRTPLGLSYGIFDSERYLLALDNRTIREVASSAPYDFIEILVNEKTYGGGGIHNWQATASVDSGFSDYVFVHEFGHAFAGLADEYYTSDVAYETGAAVHPEPWEPNITAEKDRAKLKWRDLVDGATPVPTPWDREPFERASRDFQAQRKRLRSEGAPEEKMDALFREEKVLETRLLGGMTWSGKVGAFEGAGYETKGLFRPETDCIMFTRDDVGFCRVCRKAIERVIDQYSR